MHPTGRIAGQLEAEHELERAVLALRGRDRDEGVGPLDPEQAPLATVDHALEAGPCHMCPEDPLVGRNVALGFPHQPSNRSFGARSRQVEQSSPVNEPMWAERSSSMFPSQTASVCLARSLGVSPKP